MAISLIYGQNTGLVQVGTNGSGSIDFSNASNASFSNISEKVKLVNSNSSINSNESVFLVNCQSGIVYLTLCDAGTFEGRKVTFKKVDATVNKVVVLPSTSNQTIDGQTSAEITQQWTSLTVISYDEKWYII